MEQGLRGEDLADRRRERRPTRLCTDASDLLEHLEQAVGGGVRPEVHVEGCDEPGREVELRRTHRDSRGDVRDRLVPDELVDDVRGLPELGDVDPGVVPDPSSDSATDSPDTRWSVRASG